MSVKVVQGLIGDVRSKPGVQPNQIQQNQAQTQQAAANIAKAVSANVATSEAVNVSIKNLRSSPADKIKDYKEAKEVADKTADDIRKSDSAGDVHGGLDSTSGTAHLS